MSNNSLMFWIRCCRKQTFCQVVKIERQLMKDIEMQLTAEFEHKYQKAIEQINSQALEQFNQAMQQLQESRDILQQQKQSEIQKQVQTLELALLKLEQQLTVKLQQKFLQEHFDVRIMTHSRIEQLQKQIQEQIYEVLQEKHEATKQRQIKQLIITHETKQIKLRKELDQQIKSRIYCSSGLQELKQEIKLSKTQMGSQKSQYNLKLKKIQAEIKEYQDKITEYERVGQLDQLREKYEQLRLDLLQRETQRQLQKDQKNRLNTDPEDGEIQTNKQNPYHINDEDSLDQNQDHQQNLFNNSSSSNNNIFQNQKSHSKTLKRQPRNQLLNQPRKDPYYQDQPLHEQDLQSSSNRQNTSKQNYNSKKFDLTAYFKGPLLNSQTAQITQSHKNFDQENQPKKKSLLNLKNVSDLLKQKITIDPLQKYLNKQSVSKQNDLNAQNIHSNGHKSSNFAELYEQHLKNLNKGFAKNTTKNTSQRAEQGISQMAKKIIIKNLSTYHRNNFYSNTDDNKSQSTNLGHIANEPFRTYESNLLGSYK